MNIKKLKTMPKREELKIGDKVYCVLPWHLSSDRRIIEEISFINHTDFVYPCGVWECFFVCPAEGYIDISKVMVKKDNIIIKVSNSLIFRSRQEAMKAKRKIEERVLSEALSVVSKLVKDWKNCGEN